MADNVVSLKKPAKRIWVCDCGCSTFKLREDGSAICAHCDKQSSEAADGAWYAPIKDDPDRNEDLAAPFEDIQGNGSVEFARRRLAKLATDDDVTVLAIVKSDGRVHAWSEVETPEQVDWVKDRLDAAHGLIAKHTGQAPQGQ